MRTKRLLVALSGLLGAGLVAAGFIAAPSPAYAANPTAGFNAGQIVSDANFYAGNNMSATQVQSFLKAQNPSAGSSALSKYSQTTSTRVADRYCASYPGRAGETAAQIITKVGQSCGISPKVLLVILQKETSLVTMPSPEAWRYDRAMGYACPDSGPGGTANCDSNYYGFFNQVYNSARQLKRYGVDTSVFTWFPTGKTSNIQYHPNTSCGTKAVTIKNKATAALYYYTPYTPNSAALNAGWGEGDSCSSYGNRNFYAYYKQWFGGAVNIEVDKTLADYYKSKGGENSWGQPLKAAVRISGNGGGVIQDFERGRITHSTKLNKTHGLKNGPFLTDYIANGGPAGKRGWIAGDATCGLQDSGCVVPFQFGHGTYSAKTGAQFVSNAVWSFWEAQGRESGALGYPKKAAEPLGGAEFQRFQKGSVLRNSANAYRLGAELTDAFVGAGGLPRMGMMTTPTQRINDHRYYVGFDKGNLYIDSNDGVIRLGNGPFLDAYAADGVLDAWGWPEANAACGLADSGCTMAFENGLAVYSKSTGVHFLSDEQLDAWKASGKTTGNLGYPKADVQTYDAGTMQGYQKAHMVIGPDAEVRLGNGPFLDAYLESEGPDGDWGWPLAGASCGMADGGCVMEFENTLAVYSKTTGVRTLSADQREAWEAAGAETGNLGYPTDDAQSAEEGTMQPYQKALLFVSSESTVRLGNGPFRDAYLKQGGTSGSWGWPQKPAKCGLADGGCTMEFSGGTANYTKKGGVEFEVNAG